MAGRRICDRKNSLSWTTFFYAKLYISGVLSRANSSPRSLALTSRQKYFTRAEIWRERGVSGPTFFGVWGRERNTLLETMTGAAFRATLPSRWPWLRLDGGRGAARVKSPRRSSSRGQVRVAAHSERRHVANCQALPKKRERKSDTFFFFLPPPRSGFRPFGDPKLSLRSLSEKEASRTTEDAATRIFSGIDQSTEIASRGRTVPTFAPKLRLGIRTFLAMADVSYLPRYPSAVKT